MDSTTNATVGTEEMTRQIRWIDNGRGALSGFVGTPGEALFQVNGLGGGEDWVLTGNLPGHKGKLSFSVDPDALKVRAEEWLREWLASLGASVLREALGHEIIAGTPGG